jgi:transcription elongation factor Elf1
MADEPTPPACPVCRANAVSLIATLKDQSTLDIFLCHGCGAHFSMQRHGNRADDRIRPEPA